MVPTSRGHDDPDPITRLDEDRMEELAPGVVKWFRQMPGESQVSTPCLADLDGDGTMEIVAIEEEGWVKAFDARGEDFWDEPYNATGNITPLDELAREWNWSFIPPGFFSSPKPVDMLGDGGEEIVLAENKQIITLNSSGYNRSIPLQEHYNTTQGNFLFLSTITPALHYVNDQAIVYSTGWNSSYESKFFIAGARNGDYGPIKSPISSSLTLSDHESENQYPDMFVGTMNSPLYHRSYGSISGSVSGPKPPYQVENYFSGKPYLPFATPTVVPLKDGENGILSAGVVPYGREWDEWGGQITLFNTDGSERWSYNMSELDPVGAYPNAYQNMGITMSPAAADLDGDGTPEAIIGNDYGCIISFDMETGEREWTFQAETGRNNDRLENGNTLPDRRVMSSPAICDIFSDGDQEVIIGCNNGIIYCFDGDPSDPDNDHGSGTYSWPPDGDRSQWDGIEESSAKGITEDADVLWICDTRFKDRRHSTTIPGGGNGTGISSPVVADIDNDGWLECIVGDSSGFIYCIVAGQAFRGQVDWPTFRGDDGNTGIGKGRSQVGLSFEPISIIDNIFPGEHRSFDLSLALDMSLSQSNRTTDTVHINLDVPPDDWKGRITVEGTEHTPVPVHQNPSYPDSPIIGYKWGFDLEVEDGQPVPMQMDIWAPYEYPAMGHIWFNISAAMDSASWVKATLPIDLHYMGSVDFHMAWDVPRVNDPDDIFNGEKVAGVVPGFSTSEKVGITNLGTLNESYMLTLSGIPGGWSVRFEDSGTESLLVNLTARGFIEKGGEGVSFRYLEVLITPPKSVESWPVDPITISGESKYRSTPPVVREDSYFFRKDEIGPLTMNPQQDVYTVSMSREIMVPIELTNLMAQDLGEVHLAVKDGLPPGWYVGVPKPVSQISENSSVTVTYRILIPHTALPGDSVEATFLVWSPQHSNLRKEATVRFDVIGPMGLLLEMESGDIAALPGGSMNLEIELNKSEEGNLEGRMSLLSSTGESLEWDSHSYSYAGTGPETIDIEMKVPKDVPSGTYLLYLNVSAGGSYWYVPITVTVSELRELALEVLRQGLPGETVGKDEWVDGDQLSITPAQQRSMWFRLTNGGNLPENIDIYAQDDPQESPSWTVVFTVIARGEAAYLNGSWAVGEFPSLTSMVIGPGEVIYLRLNVTMSSPQEISPGYLLGDLANAVVPTFNLTIVSKGYGNGSLDSVEDIVVVTFKLGLPLLSIDGTPTVEMPVEPKEGDPVILSITIDNRAYWDAEMASIVIVVDELESKRFDHVTIPALGSQTVVVIWDYRLGVERLEVRLEDGMNNITGQDYSDSVVFDLPASAGKDDEVISGSAVMGISAVFILGALIIFLFFILPRLRSAENGDDETASRKELPKRSSKRIDEGPDEDEPEKAQIKQKKRTRAEGPERIKTGPSDPDAE